MDLKDFKYTVADGKQNKITINDGFKVDASDTKTTPYGFPDFLTKGILPINTFTFTHNDLCTCRRKIYYVRQKFFTKPQTDKYIDQGHKETPSGLQLIKHSARILSGFKTALIDQKKYKVGQRVRFTLTNDAPKDKKMEVIPVIFNRQLMGLLYPGETLDLTFTVDEFTHKGCHAYHIFNILGKDDMDLLIWSYYTMKEFISMMESKDSKSDCEKKLSRYNDATIDVDGQPDDEEVGEAGLVAPQNKGV